MVEAIRDEVKKFDATCEIVYLPNLMPLRPVKYVFIAMEPSFGRWARNEEDAKRRIREGFRNFILTWEDFILHYCIHTYLSPSYYVTDISQAAMKVKNADYWRDRIYPKWIDLLTEEIELVGQEACKLIFVGTKVETFLKPKQVYGKLSNRDVVKTILHYSGQAGRQRKVLPYRYPEEFHDFKKNQTLSSKIILDFATMFLKENDIPVKTVRWILSKLKHSKTRLSESRKELMFTYYHEFRELATSFEKRERMQTS